MYAVLAAHPFYELTALLALALVVGLLGHALRQPMIVSFIAVGVLAGPSALGLIQNADPIDLLAELGIAVLLFLVGLKLDLKHIRTLGPVAVATGLGQVFFTSLIGYGLGLLLGLDHLSSLYVAVALTFSSTIIIVKLLSDKKEVDSLHGRIAIGFLIVQDLVVVIAMIVLAALQGQQGQGWQQLGWVVLNGGLMLLGVLAFIRFIANPLLHWIARSAELLLIFTLALAAILAAVGQLLGFSMELGGLLAGIALASTPYRDSIGSRLNSVRDFLLLFFFIALGTSLDLSLLGSQIWPALLLSLFVLLGNPLIVMVIMGALGYRRYTGFHAGLTVAQISEFSLIFIAMGVELGHLNQQALGLVTLVGIITIAASVYMITYSQQLYRCLEPYLGCFERRHPQREQSPDQHQLSSSQLDAILYGCGRFGQAIAEHLLSKGYRLAIVDFDPASLQAWHRHPDVICIYGDAYDPEFVSQLPLAQVRWVISTLPHYHTYAGQQDPRQILVQDLQRQGFNGKVALTSHQRHEEARLQQLGADIVLLPYRDAAEQAAYQISKSDAP